MHPLSPMIKISYEDLILETLPFADQLKAWCKSHPQFYEALKVIYSERFVHLGAIVISQPSNYPQDEVIGIYAYDYKLKNPKFKQDFIVNKDKEYKEFLLYTRNPKGSSKWVKDINQFYATYGKNGDYANSHHVSFNELPEELRPQGKRAIEIAEIIKTNGPRRLTQEEINQEFERIMVEKKKPWRIEKKMDKTKHSLLNK